ncbi:hypothetical protein HPB50_014110 [Hyalomma asiaticum]|uniref:Uncharacterized protein n=1 Tax=Hyalomma asiaticum TaxID=266040 RepID=A0ACB7S2L2_HYAAI|nr:hypothetical protein HPB50_014110 [Hyalomma asiaticum]
MYCRDSSYGIMNEPVALEEYEATHQAKVSRLGLVISPEVPWLGYSPDGISRQRNMKILLEVKCPVLGKNHSIVNLVKEKKLPYIVLDGEKYVLKPAHKYYSQVQLGMLVLNMDICHFVVFSKVSSLVVEVPRDRLPQQQIADMNGRYRSSVNRIMKAFSTEARLTNLSRGHRPNVTTDSDDDRIVEAARRNPKMTAKEIRNDLGLAASTQIVRERLHVGGLRSRVAAIKPFVSSRNRVKRLLFAQEHRSWTVEEWRNVIFTDESTFTSKWDQQQRTWRTQGTRFDAPNLHRVASSGRCSANVWGSISKDCLGPLMREAVDGFGKAVTKCFDDRAKVAGEIVSEINAALQRIAENEKTLDAIKATMEAA